MKNVTIKLTREQREQIKKATGENVAKLNLLPPAKAEKKAALRARGASVLFEAEPVGPLPTQLEP